MREDVSQAAYKALERDSGQLVTSVVAAVEIRSALTRLEYENRLSSAGADVIFERARRDLERTPRKLALSDDVLSEALRLLESNRELPLKALDCLHVATCLRYGTNGFVTNDKQQAQFAEKVGLRVHYLADNL